MFGNGRQKKPFKATTTRAVKPRPKKLTPAERAALMRATWGERKDVA